MTDISKSLIAAIVSLFFPGLGYALYAKEKMQGILIFVAYLVLWAIIAVITVVTMGIGSICFIVMPIINLLAAVHSYDMVALQEGDATPIIFKKKTNLPTSLPGEEPKKGKKK